ncbi:hypothetical protein D9615_010673 [Tricholomella constricta]|uniref:Uncharacterized protein n=1 Tax=Tricholomella constricta TaxID=117010 RepID=A0A8H5LRZ8_9AGAR|nr:hypothetical protein D9615_010673 [Tricholomella constricta]
MDPVNPTGRAGIAIVLNKELTNVNGARITEIVPGRAIHIQTNWHRAEQISILSVYAPNLSNGDENAKFWKTIHDYLVTHPRMKVDIMTGDFNMVEDTLDRIPAREDPQEAVEELDNLKSMLGLVDGWRTTFPTTKVFSFLQDATRAQSRLDRMYVTLSILQTAREWKMEPSGIPGTDHKMISAQVAHQNAPWIGKGRWSIPIHILKDKIFKEKTNQEGIKALKEIEDLTNPRSADKNAQTIFETFKSEVLTLARQRDKMIMPRTHLDKRKKILVRNRLEGETICKYWTKTNKAAKPRDMIFALKNDTQHEETGQPQYESHSQRMTELGRNYHDKLQADDHQPQNESREEAIESTTSNIEKTISREQKENLIALITRQEVIEALRCAKNDTAAGIDGATNEMWKALHARHEDDIKRDSDSAFDIAQLLTVVFVDIQRFGLTTSSKFADGWMCPLYKKNERTEIANYKPITCLNTDYKLSTKCLATRLADIAPSIIHPSQAGFIKGRQISDQTKLIRLMMHYAEETDQDGLIITLDQEKAYDKIKHDYLWKTLKKFNIPEEFIKPIRSLYESAETKIMINGYLSFPWKITRGVRQGDPLSCLLFDLAIEPLAASIRASMLEGFKIPGNEEKLIANLFADDTTIFLSKNDSLTDLYHILDKWCDASGAKFNTSKTEIILIGSKTFRENVIATRRTTIDAEEIPASVHIAQEGEAVRILGAWFGNRIDAESPWSIVLDKINANLARWERSNPTIEGRCLIVSMIVGGMTQYLTQVQGMPQKIEKRLTKTIRNFMWKDKRSPVSEATLFLNTKEGGRDLLDLAARNEAIDIMWLKKYLDFSETRPMWALIAGALFAKNTPRSEANIDKRVRINAFLQSWKTSTTEKSGACPDLRRLLKTAKTYGLKTEGIAFTNCIVRLRPIWYHNDADQKIRRLNHGPISECLKGKHKIRTVGDAENLADILLRQDYRTNNQCICQGCDISRVSQNCTHPHDCAMKAEALLSTLPEKWHPRKAPDPPPPEQEDLERPPNPNTNDDWLTFNDHIITDGDLTDIFRIFTQGQTVGSLPRTTPQSDNGPILQATTDGSCFNNGSDNATAGAGVFYAEGDERNIKMKVPQNFAPSNQTAELLALKEAAEKAPEIGRLQEAAEKAPEIGRLHLELDSKYVIKMVTKSLKENEDKGYTLTANEELTRITIARLRARNTVTRFKWVKGHAGHKRNEGADALADEAANLPVNGDPNCAIPPTLQVSGMKLTCATQALAYKVVRRVKTKKTPPKDPELKKILRR